MGKIKKITENKLVGGTQSTDIYPVTSTKAVYDESNERLDNILAKKFDKENIAQEFGDSKDKVVSQFALPFREIENEDFLKAIVDSDDKVLFGFYRATGKPYYPLNEMYHVEQNEEFFAVWLDDANHVLLGIRRDGQIIGEIPAVNALKQVISQLQSDVAALQEKGSTIDPNLTELLDVFSLQENPEYIQVTTDNKNKILEGITSYGTKIINLNLAIKGTLSINGKKLSESTFCNIQAYKNLVSNNYWDAAFTAALSENNNIYIPAGEYNVQNSIVLPNNITIFADADAAIYRVVQQETITHENCRVLYAENKSNITIIGGYWDSNTKVIGTLVREHSCRGTLSFFRCHRLTILNCSIKCFRGSFCIQPGSCSNMVISNIYFDDAKGCGVQVGGNTNNFDISNLSGSCHDDMVALNGYDWWTSSAEIGTIQCGRVHNLYPNSATAAVRVNVGIANKDSQTYIGIVKDIIIENIYGTYNLVNAVHIGTEEDEYGSRSPLAYADNIIVRNVNCQPIDGIENHIIRLFGNIGTLILENIADSHIRGILYANGYANVKMLVIKNYKADSNNSLYIDGHIQRLILDNIQKTEESQQSFALISSEYGIVDDITIKNSCIQSGYSVFSVTNNGSLYKVKYIDCDIANVRLVCNYTLNIQTVLLLDNVDLQNIVTSEGNFLIKNSVYQ